MESWTNERVLSAEDFYECAKKSFPHDNQIITVLTMSLWEAWCAFKNWCDALL